MLAQTSRPPAALADPRQWTDGLTAALLGPGARSARPDGASPVVRGGRGRGAGGRGIPRRGLPPDGVTVEPYPRGHGWTTASGPGILSAPTIGGLSRRRPPSGRWSAAPQPPGDNERVTDLPRAAVTCAAKLATLPLRGRSRRSRSRQPGRGKPAEAVAAEMQARAATQLFTVLGELAASNKFGQALSISRPRGPRRLPVLYRAMLTKLQDSAPATPPPGSRK